MKNVFAIGAERDGTLRHAQCAILNGGEALPLEHRPGALWGAQACRPVFQFPRRENTKVRNLLSGGRDSVEPTEIRLAPRRVALPQWHAWALCFSRDRKCKNKSQAAKMAAATSSQLV